MKIQDWLSSASVLCSPSDYIKHCIVLAFKLVENLRPLVASGQIQLQRLTVDNITVLVSGTPSNLSVQSVQFDAVFPDTDSLQKLSIEEGEGRERRAGELPRVQSQACVALGDILLQLFSKRQRRDRKAENPTGAKDVTGLSGSGEDTMEPAGKRMTRIDSVTSDSSKASQAERVFEEMGMPVSIKRLVCDLLDAENGHRPDTALNSLDEALWDLNQMREDATLFLFDRTCPKMALDDACLFGSAEKHIFGRETEINILMQSVKRTAQHVAFPPPNRVSSFVCNSAFVHGCAGIGKSTVLKRVVNVCTETGWFIIDCRFSTHIPPERALANAFDAFFAFFEQWSQSQTAARMNSPKMNQFQRVCKCILSSVDATGYRQLVDLVPNLSKVFPHQNNPDKGSTSSSFEKVGAAKDHLKNQFYILFKSLCESGCPVLLSIDNIQWSDPFILECIVDFVIRNDLGKRAVPGSHNQGMLILGTYRNELNGEISKVLDKFQMLGEGGTLRLCIGDLTKDQLVDLISQKLCMPRRYVKGLATLVQWKTLGNPFFVIQLLKSLVQNGMLEYSIKSRSWSWDLEIIELQVISEGVAELLIARFHQLPGDMLRTLEILSCLGLSAHDSTIDILNAKQNTVFDMHDELHLAINEGILERSGLISYLAAPGNNDGSTYQFTHDTIQKTIYDSMSPAKRKLLHIENGECLLKSANSNPSIYLLATDQINLYCEGVTLSSAERSQFATVNATAAKHALAMSSFGRARSYVNTGITLLNTNHWKEQYSLSLDLYEMSASVGFMLGDIGTMPETLSRITENVKSFEDSLIASSLLAKLLASSSKYDEAITVCLSVLSNLGEIFPENMDRTTVLNELLEMRAILHQVDSVHKVKLLPNMINASKRRAMQFLSLLSVWSVIAKPVMFPLIAKRLLTITIEHGLCEDSLKGLVMTGWALFAFSNETLLGHRISKVGATLIADHPNKNALLCKGWGYIGWLNAVVEPFQSVLEGFLDRYNEGMLMGDHEHALLNRWGYCAASFYIGVNPLTLSKQIVLLIHQTGEYQQTVVRYVAMSLLHACMSLTGVAPEEIDATEIKSHDQLSEIAQSPPNAFLSYQNMVCATTVSFWKRDFIRVAERTTQHFRSVKKKGIFETSLIFFEGMASLYLARQTCQPKWRVIGERAMIKMNQMVSVSTWNYENKSKLLQAEFHYVCGDLESADNFYKASVTSALKHKFPFEGALALEAYGFFLVENENLVKGTEQLCMAVKKYKELGALEKARDLQCLIHEK